MPAAPLDAKAVDHYMVLAGIDSYRELARRLGWHETSLNHILRGRRNALPRHVIAIANTLGVAFTDLLRNDPERVA